MKDYLFAYGTLAEEHAPQEIAGAVTQLRYVGQGFVFGRLYDLGEYPGAVLEGDRHHKIFGKIFELPADAALLERLDAYEGFDPKRPSKSLFLRRRTAISRPGKSRLKGWVYEYNGNVKSVRKIENGQYTRGAVLSRS